ncbi:uncharacterized protein LOC131709736 isoform X2 [Acipenser ruthenus]|uniref:uncharacterized protein LOC131709736 isoform X2 n=1 Tax=Acipenser ruthenus TaxID=7906 RepID=UPI0027403ACB|nr:uncharacterized protein LOC131709736 isoform X2 [Acipenser ruthenus]
MEVGGGACPLTQPSPDLTTPPEWDSNPGPKPAFKHSYRRQRLIVYRSSEEGVMETSKEERKRRSSPRLRQETERGNERGGEGEIQQPLLRERKKRRALEGKIHSVEQSIEPKCKVQKNSQPENTQAPGDQSGGRLNKGAGLDISKTLNSESESSREEGQESESQSGRSLAVIGGCDPQAPPPALLKGWVIGPLFQSLRSKMASFTEIVMSPTRLFRTGELMERGGGGGGGGEEERAAEEEDRGRSPLEAEEERRELRDWQTGAGLTGGVEIATDVDVFEKWRQETRSARVVLERDSVTAGQGSERGSRSPDGFGARFREPATPGSCSRSAEKTKEGDGLGSRLAENFEEGVQLGSRPPLRSPGEDRWAGSGSPAKPDGAARRRSRSQRGSSETAGLAEAFGDNGASSREEESQRSPVLDRCLGSSRWPSKCRGAHTSGVGSAGRRTGSVTPLRCEINLGTRMPIQSAGARLRGSRTLEQSIEEEEEFGPPTEMPVRSVGFELKSTERAQGSRKHRRSRQVYETGSGTPTKTLERRLLRPRALLHASGVQMSSRAFSMKMEESKLCSRQLFKSAASERLGASSKSQEVRQGSRVPVDSSEPAPVLEAPRLLSEAQPDCRKSQRSAEKTGLPVLNALEGECSRSDLVKIPRSGHSRTPTESSGTRNIIKEVQTQLRSGSPNNPTNGEAAGSRLHTKCAKPMKEAVVRLGSRCRSGSVSKADTRPRSRRSGLALRARDGEGGAGRRREIPPLRSGNEMEICIREKVCEGRGTSGMSWGKDLGSELEVARKRSRTRARLRDENEGEGTDKRTRLRQLGTTRGAKTPKLDADLEPEEEEEEEEEEEREREGIYKNRKRPRGGGVNHGTPTREDPVQGGTTPETKPPRLLRSHSCPDIPSCPADTPCPAPPSPALLPSVPQTAATHSLQPGAREGAGDRPLVSAQGSLPRVLLLFVLLLLLLVPLLPPLLLHAGFLLLVQPVGLPVQTSPRRQPPGRRGRGQRCHFLFQLLPPLPFSPSRFLFPRSQADHLVPSQSPAPGAEWGEGLGPQTQSPHHERRGGGGGGGGGRGGRRAALLRGAGRGRGREAAVRLQHQDQVRVSRGRGGKGGQSVPNQNPKNTPQASHQPDPHGPAQTSQVE